ncbi:MAG: host-nuclease inhibitor Gam family protein [Deltaproteobacteria bacterium]|nr:host-nuclease inhibitor Gam family protein [Deltaproteobacteria bacterium]
MSTKKYFASPIQAEADRQLAAIREAQVELDRLQAKLAEELRAFQASQGKIDWQQRRVAYLDKELKDFMKAHRADLFPEVILESYSLDLPHGALLYAREDYVVKPRKVDVLANLMKYGFEEAIRRTAAVDWDVLEDKNEWPDAALALIGTRRETKETYAYEVKEQ